MYPPRPWSPPEGPFRGSDLRPLGITARKLAGEVRRGTLVRLRQGVYVAASSVPDHPGRLHLLRALAEQLVSPDLVASHDTAALAWHLPHADELHAPSGPLCFVLRRSDEHRSVARSDLRIRLSLLPDHHVTRADDGLRVTTRARTAVDLATRLSLPEALIPLDAALRAECAQMPFVSRRRDLANPRVRTAALAPLLEAAACCRHDDLGEALGLADPRHETPIESLSRGHIHEAGIPAPMPQHEVVTAIGSCYPDFLWPEYGVIGEADGRIKYRDANDMMREKAREQALRDLGLTVVRWSGKEIHVTPRVVMDRLARALWAAGWRGEPSGKPTDAAK